jgi:hypothetical protein
MSCYAFVASSMHFCTALPTCQSYLWQARRVMPQLNLNFTDLPIPETYLWEQWDDEQKRIVIEILSRLLIQATRDQQQEQTND